MFSLVARASCDIPAFFRQNDILFPIIMYNLLLTPLILHRIVRKRHHVNFEFPQSGVAYMIFAPNMPMSLSDGIIFIGNQFNPIQNSTIQSFANFRQRFHSDMHISSCLSPHAGACFSHYSTHLVNPQIFPDYFVSFAVTDNM